MFALAWAYELDTQSIANGDQLVAQRHHVVFDIRQTDFVNHVQGTTQCMNRRKVKVTDLEAVGVFAKYDGLIAGYQVSTSVGDPCIGYVGRGQRIYASSGVHEAEALWCQQAFVTAGGDSADAHIAHVDRQYANGLHRVSDHFNTASFCKCDDVCQVIALTAVEHNVGDSDCLGAVIHIGGKGRCISPFLVSRHQSNFQASIALSQPSVGVVWVLAFEQQYVVARFPLKAARTDVEAFGGVLGERDLVRLSADERSQFGTNLFNTGQPAVFRACIVQSGVIKRIQLCLHRQRQRRLVSCIEIQHVIGSWEIFTYGCNIEFGHVSSTCLLNFGNSYPRA
ncbi:Zn-dependent amino- or carboxypeptidase [Pseudomonas syringae pv. actinidiae]|uniref:Zn-dependent amino-or carboxypeptidase n=1 Tax=Pseudomonas syringae pv. actinidiae TaxID=103796 RepID=A0A2V0QLQ3_PSESF|nr:Zn-dependent amino- or carboxypeptidase [Pseudomonas syringae pv. actinidiae]